MQNHERERKVRMDAGGGGDFVELPRPGRHPPCQLLSDLHYLSQNLSPSQTHHRSSLRQLQQLHQLQLPQQPSQEGPSPTHLTMVRLPVEGRRWSLGRGLTPRISSLCAPFPHRAGGSHCGLCSPFKSFLDIGLDMGCSLSQWSRLRQPLPEPHREESHLLHARPELNLL